MTCSPVTAIEYNPTLGVLEEALLVIMKRIKVVTRVLSSLYRREFFYIRRNLHDTLLTLDI